MLKLSYFLLEKCEYLLKRAGLEEILNNLNEDVRSFILNQPNESKQYYIAAIKKNPDLTLLELQNLEFPQKKEIEISATDRIEKNFINDYFNPKLFAWALIQAKKLRKHKPIKYLINILRAFNNGIMPANEHTEPWLKNNNMDPELSNYVIFLTSFGELEDWYNAEEPQLASYTAQQALAASEEWHRRMAERGANKIYEEGNINVVYGPNWKDNQFNGWTIKQIKSPNDLDVEGHLMDHCVGSYAEEVEQDSSQIYSLRDPSNKPHVTIETQNGNNVKQIMGKSNSDPKPQYKSMVKEWLQYLQSNGKKLKSELDSTDIQLINLSHQDDIIEYINSSMDGGNYGIKPDLLHLKIKETYENSLDYLENLNEKYNLAFQRFKKEKLPKLGQDLAKIALDHDVQWLEYLLDKEIKVLLPGEASWMGKYKLTPEEIKRDFIKHSAVVGLERIFNNNYEEIMDHVSYNEIPNEPLEENYQSTEEWKKAYQIYEDKLQEQTQDYYGSNDLPYVLDRAIKEGFNSYSNIVNEIISKEELSGMVGYGQFS